MGGLLALTLMLATSLLFLGVIISAFYDGPPMALLVALLVTFTLRFVMSLFQTVNRRLRRRTRLRRIQGLSNT